MKLKTFAAKSRSSSYGYLRGLSQPHTHADRSAHENPQDELPSIEIEASSTPRPTAALRDADDASTANRTTRWALRSPRLIGERAHRFHFLEAHAVDYLEVDGNYVTICVGVDRYLTRSTLKHLSDVLAPYDFIRIDRSVLLNLRQVEYVERLEGGQFSFQLRCGQRLVSSRERSSAIARLLRSGVR